MVAGRDFNGSVGWELVRGTVLRAGVSRVGEEAAERGAAGSSAAGGRGDLRRVSWHRARACPAAERRQARRRPPTCSVGGGAILVQQQLATGWGVPWVLTGAAWPGKGGAAVV